MSVAGLCILVLSAGTYAASPEAWTERLDGLLKADSPSSPIVVLPDDWQTGGSWPGRYGEDAWVLCGMSGRWSYTGGRLKDRFEYQATIGERCDPGDGLRAWIHWPYLPKTVPEEVEERPADEQAELRGPLGQIAPRGMAPWDWPDVRRVLINPVNGGRRQSSWDDHAEAYRPWFSREGPHLYVHIVIPEGPAILSFYFVNKDAHVGVNRFRDYLIEIKDRQDASGKTPGWEKGFEKAPLLARCPVSNFYDGVYKRFLFLRAANATVRINKGDSINAILSGIFLDSFVLKEEKPHSAFQRMLWRSGARDLWDLVEKLREAKAKSPANVAACFTELAADCGTWATEALGNEELKVGDLDRLEALCALLGEVRRYGRRDELWENYVQCLQAWFEHSTDAEILGRKRSFWDRCERARYLAGISDAQVADLAGAYFKAIARLRQRLAEAQGLVPPPQRSRLTVIEELRKAGRLNATSRPRVALEALQVLDQWLRERDGNAPFSSFSAEELFALAQSYRQIREHAASARYFQELLTRFPNHPLKTRASERLRQEREMAHNQEQIQNQQYTVAHQALRPRVVPAEKRPPTQARRESGETELPSALHSGELEPKAE